MKRFVTVLALSALLPLGTACEKQDKSSPPTPQVSSDQPPPAAAPPSGSQGTAPGAQAGGDTTAAAAGGDTQQGEKVYKQVCATCHDQGLAGAPKVGDKGAWQPRIAKGMETLVKNSIQGFQGNQGVMPPRGGVQSLSDQDVSAAVTYMVERSR